MGATLIAGLLALLWTDQTLAGQPIPGWLPGFGLTHVPPGAVVFPVMLVIAFMASRELARILREKQIAASTGITCGASILGLGVSCLVPESARGDVGGAVTASAGVLVLVGALVNYSRHRNTQGVVAAAGGTLLAFVYLGLMFGFVLAIRRHHSAWVLLFILITTKSSDIGAYTFGRLFGRHKLIPWLSPGKTWEGLFGGMLVSAGVGGLGLWALHQAGYQNLPPVWSGFPAGATAALFGQVGDLIMSLFKRDAGRKDSGHSLPGFGGVLDVLDSALLVAPLAYWWLRLN